MENPSERLDRVIEILEGGALEDLRVAADELATCTNEQKLARRLRIHAENLREAAGIREREEAS